MLPVPTEEWADIFRLSYDGNEGASAGVELLGGREGDGEERVLRSDHFESGIYAPLAISSQVVVKDSHPTC